ncbi:hypothetical protein WJX84_006835 [Apatococcus fuscideae]|uniref:Uncharacterized protein n=1 Tax=Apatococcus fuscideae TaxID=2026836 RepID=A0AAW1SWU5_9CHLO
MAASTCTLGSRTCLQGPRKLCRHQTTRRSLQPVRAEGEKPQEGQGQKLSFEASRRAAMGYTEEDSAGQTNIFAVEPKKYIQNAADDMASGSATSNLVIAISAFAVGAAILTFGIFVNRNDSESPIAEELGQFKTLSEYQREFSS